MDVSLAQLILGGSAVSVIAGAIKYIIDAFRQSKKDKDPVTVATATTTVMQSAMSTLHTVTEDLTGENARLRLLLSETEIRLRQERSAHEERERSLKMKIEELEQRVRDLDGYVTSLSADIRAFREGAFPETKQM